MSISRWLDFQLLEQRWALKKKKVECAKISYGSRQTDLILSMFSANFDNKQEYEITL